MPLLTGGAFLPTNTVTGMGAWTFTSITCTGTVTISTVTATTVNKVTITAPTTGATLTISNGKTFTAAETLTFTGTSGTTFTFPTGSMNVLGSTGPAFAHQYQAVTATGATGSTAAAITASAPAFVHATGVSGAGINLPTGAATTGALFIIYNLMTGVLNVYSTGATINGVTGTTAYAITATGNLTAIASCSTAGAWIVRGNT